MNRLGIGLFQLAWIICLLITPAVHADEPVLTKKPNILFILADDWGWGDLRCYGHRALKTPHLDKLAQQGTRFTQFYSCASVCSPSRVAWMTGQYPARHRIHGHLAQPWLNQQRGMPDFLDPAVPTVPRLLKSVGYTTCHIGKWHLGDVNAPLPPEYGFDVDYSVMTQKPAWKMGEAGFWPSSSEWFVDKAIDFIEANKDRPFYAQVWLIDVHARLQPTDEQMEPYKNYLGALKIYYSAVTNADRQIGRLLARLDELGLSDNTIVIFSSDNGPEEIEIGNASEHGVGSTGPFRGRKRSIYEGGIRVPFILRWPGVTPAGKVDDEALFCAADFLPTLSRITGFTLPEGYQPDGEPVLPLWQGKSLKRTKPMMWEWRYTVFGHVWNRSPILAIRDGDYKLLMNPDGGRVELYDIPRDLTEQNNLADRHPEIVKRLSEQVLAWQKTLPESPLDKDAGSNAYPWPK